MLVIGLGVEAAGRSALHEVLAHVPPCRGWRNGGRVQRNELTDWYRGEVSGLCTDARDRLPGRASSDWI
jgi:hypothetical protein